MNNYTDKPCPQRPHHHELSRAQRLGCGLECDENHARRDRQVPESVGLASHSVNARWIVLTHDLDKPHNWWADGPFDSRQDAEAHKAKLRTAAIEGKGLQKGLLENLPKYVRSRTVHQVLVLVDPEDRARMERWT